MSEKQYLEILGYQVRDRVTNFQGVAVSVSFDLSGCVQVYILPPIDKDGKVPDGRWIDHKRLTYQEAAPVMTAPIFEDVPGGEKLPSPERNY